jgi:hypothetical protein
MSEDLESLGERIAEQAAHLDAALHRLLTDLRTFDRGGGWHTQGARSCAHWLSWRVGWDLGTAREHLRVADRLADLPLLDDALRRGELSYSKLRAITRVATPANEAALLEIARRSPGHQLETICRKYRSVLLHDADPDPDGDRARRWVVRRDTANGMVRIEAVLHPEEAAFVWAALDHRAQQQCRESRRVSAETSSSAPPVAPDARDGGAHVHPARSCAPFDRADALVQIAQGYLRGDRPDRSPIELVVSVSRRDPAPAARRHHGDGSGAGCGHGHGHGCPGSLRRGVPRGPAPAFPRRPLAA